MIDNLSIGILTWKKRATFNDTIETYKKNGLLELSNDILVFIQESNQDKIQDCNTYQLKYIESETNINIAQGFKNLVMGLSNEFILLLEHDWKLIADKETTENMLRLGIKYIQDNEADCVRYRSIDNPGVPLQISDIVQDCHLLNYVYKTKDINDEKIKIKDNNYFTDSRYANFTNNPCIYRKLFYIDNVIPNAILDLENDFTEDWRNAEYKICQTTGLFTHIDNER